MYIPFTYWIQTHRRLRRFNIDCVDGLPTINHTKYTTVFLESDVLIGYGNDGYKWWINANGILFLRNLQGQIKASRILCAISTTFFF